jgi:hypothetical protein
MENALREKLRKISLIGRKVKARRYGDYSHRPVRYEIAIVRDEVAVIHEADDAKYDIRFSVQQLLFNDGAIFFRFAYHRWEGRVRKGQSKLRIGWGQYAAILPSEIAQRLNEQMFFKAWEPWAKMDSLLSLS